MVSGASALDLIRGSRADFPLPERREAAPLGEKGGEGNPFFDAGDRLKY
jgi:hypothetical protein